MEKKLGKRRINKSTTLLQNLNIFLMKGTLLEQEEALSLVGPSPLMVLHQLCTCRQNCLCAICTSLHSNEVTGGWYYFYC